MTSHGPMSRFLPFAAAFAVALAAVLAIGSAPAAAGNLAPSSGALYGAYVPGGPSGISNFESKTGHKLAIDNHFWAWTDSWPTSSYESWDVKNGRIPMVSWDGPNTTLANITNGSQDSVIKARANAAKAFGKQMLVRWGYEMNGHWFDWSGASNGNNPAAYIAAWKHIVNIFRNAGATNVLWIWTVNNGDNPNVSWNNYANYYPGDDYVDWVGIDGYNWGTSASWATWQSFAQVFTSGGSTTPYQKYAGHKPIMIAETGSVEVGGNKGAWYEGIPGALQSSLPGIKAVVFFETIHNGTNMSSQSSSGAFAGYKQMLTSSVWNASSGVTSTPTAAAPANTAAPSISGSTAVGATLTGSKGSWSGSPTGYKYQWQRCTIGSYSSTVLADSPSGYWHLSETSGTVAADASTANADGTYSGGVQLNASGAFAGSSAALLSGGASGSVSLGDRFDFAGKSAFTLEGWVKPQALDSYGRRLFSKETVDSSGHQGYLVWVSATGIGFERWANGWHSQVIASTKLPTGAWSYVAATYDGSAMRLYVNGREVASGSSSLSIPTLSAPLTINGASGGGNYLTATVDEPAVYGRALSGSQISAHYSAAGGSGSGACSAISGATGSSYTATSSDRGATLRLVVTASNSAGSASATSNATAAVS
jgi:Concanavalin A-like lectin/glucanases superfamily/Glycosyl hydrolase family 26